MFLNSLTSKPKTVNNAVIFFSWVIDNRDISDLSASEDHEEISELEEVSASQIISARKSHLKKSDDLRFVSQICHMKQFVYYGFLISNVCNYTISV